MQILYVTKESAEFIRIRKQIRRAAKTPVPEKLIEQIRSAFANTSPPKQIAWLLAHVLNIRALNVAFKGNTGQK